MASEISLHNLISMDERVKVNKTNFQGYATLNTPCFSINEVYNWQPPTPLFYNPIFPDFLNDESTSNN